MASAGSAGPFKGGGKKGMNVMEHMAARLKMIETGASIKTDDWRCPVCGIIIVGSEPRCTMCGASRPVGRLSGTPCEAGDRRGMAIAADKPVSAIRGSSIAAVPNTTATSTAAAPVIDWNNPAFAYQVAQNPFLLASLTAAFPKQAQQAEIDPIDPDVLDLGEYFGLERVMCKKLHDALKERPSTADGDIAALYEILEHARSPPAMLTTKIREMEANTFIGNPKAGKDILKMKKMYKLDDEAVRKLSAVLVTREATREEDIEQLHRHLETSNKPSARVMTLLSKLRSGDPLPEPSRRSDHGSYLDKMQKKKDDEDRERSREPQRDSSRYHSPTRENDGNKSPRRERRRSRSYGRGR